MVYIKLNYFIGLHFRMKISSRSPFFILSQSCSYFGKIGAIRSFPLVVH